MNYQTMDAMENRQDNTFISRSKWLVILVLALIGTYWNHLSYNNALSFLMQTVLLGMIFVVYSKQPVMLIVAYILLNILPTRMYGGFTESAHLYYALNPKISIASALLFFALGMFISRHKFRIRYSILLFVCIMIASMFWTRSFSFYNMDFWWMCIAYLVLPMFIQDDGDVRVVLAAYITAVDMFCLNVLPILASKDKLYRGIVNLDPNYAALFVIISVALIMIIFTVYRSLLSKKITLFLLASAIISIITLAYFASRTSFVMLLFLVLAYLYFNLKQIKTTLISLIAVVTTFMVLNQYGLFNSIIMRFAEPNARTAGGRFDIQQALLESIFRLDPFHFLFGNGYLTTGYFGIGAQAHNSYISILVSFGLIGLIVYGIYLIEIYFILNKTRYRPFLILFGLLFLYGFSLEPYLIIEGILFFSVLNGMSNINPQPSSDSPAHP